MRTALRLSILVLLACAGVAEGQTRPDLTGLWISQAADISVLLLPGQEIALTPYGAERYRKLDMARRCAHLTTVRTALGTIGLERTNG